MHIVHKPEFKREDWYLNEKNPYIYAVIGIFFDTRSEFMGNLSDDEITNVNNFFDSLRWDNTNGNPKVDEIRFGEFL